MPIIRRKQLYLCNTWYLLFCMDECLACRVDTRHPYRITSTNCRINTVVSPDYGHIFARNVAKRNKHTKKNCAPSWLYLKECDSCIHARLKLWDQFGHLSSDGGVFAISLSQSLLIIACTKPSTLLLIHPVCGPCRFICRNEPRRTL